MDLKTQAGWFLQRNQQRRLSVHHDPDVPLAQVVAAPGAFPCELTTTGFRDLVAVVRSPHQRAAYLLSVDIHWTACLNECVEVTE
jgi:sulfite reductase beta subunit-like hemoprotein